MPGKKIIYHASEPVLIERNNSNLAILIEEREVMVLILNHKVISSWAANSYLMIENDHEKSTVQNRNLANLIKKGEVMGSIPNHNGISLQNRNKKSRKRCLILY